jgi:hypothetical protein
MHPGGTTYDYTLKAKSQSTAETHFIIEDDKGDTHYYPRIFTILTIKKSA